MFCALTLGGTASFTVRRQSHPRDPPQGYAEFQRTRWRKNACELAYRASARCATTRYTDALPPSSSTAATASSGWRRATPLQQSSSASLRWSVGWSPAFPLTPAADMPSHSLMAASCQLRPRCVAANYPVIRSAWWRRLSSCCRCAARRLRDSRNAIYGMSAHWQRAYSGLILAARITLPHFSVSSAMSLPKSAGESASGTLPRSARRALIL